MLTCGTLGRIALPKFEGKHVEVHRTEKDKKKMPYFEKYVIDGNEKVDELAKVGAIFDEGFMAKTVKQEREEDYAALHCAASFHCLVEEWKGCEELKPKPKETWIFVDKKREVMKHQTEWCAQANKYRCMKCGRSSKYMKMPEKCTGPKCLSKNWENGWKKYLGSHDLV